MAVDTTASPATARTEVGLDPRGRRLRSLGHHRRLHRALLVVAVTLLVSMAGCSLQLPASSRNPHHRTVSFPDVELEQSERIVGVEIVLTCGRFCAVNRIPDDWSLHVEAPVSEVTSLKAACQHGASALPSVAELSKLATVCSRDESCFDISGTIVTTVDFENERRRSFSRAELILE